MKLGIWLCVFAVSLSWSSAAAQTQVTPTVTPTSSGIPDVIRHTQSTPNTPASSARSNPAPPVDTLAIVPAPEATGEVGGKPAAVETAGTATSDPAAPSSLPPDGRTGQPRRVPPRAPR
jgi:hypothetical protein